MLKKYKRMYQVFKDSIAWHVFSTFCPHSNMIKCYPKYSVEYTRIGSYKHASVRWNGNIRVCIKNLRLAGIFVCIPMNFLDFTSVKDLDFMANNLPRFEISFLLLCTLIASTYRFQVNGLWSDDGNRNVILVGWGSYFYVRWMLFNVLWAGTGANLLVVSILPVNYRLSLKKIKREPFKSNCGNA